MLSYGDNRMLPERGRGVRLGPSPGLMSADGNTQDRLDDGGFAVHQIDLSDNGFSQAIIIQALDLKYYSGAEED